MVFSDACLTPAACGDGRRPARWCLTVVLVALHDLSVEVMQREHATTLWRRQSSPLHGPSCTR